MRSEARNARRNTKRFMEAFIAVAVELSTSWSNRSDVRRGTTSTASPSERFFGHGVGPRPSSVTTSWQSLRSEIRRVGQVAEAAIGALCTAGRKREAAELARQLGTPVEMLRNTAG